MTKRNTVLHAIQVWAARLLLILGVFVLGLQLGARVADHYGGFLYTPVQLSIAYLTTFCALTAWVALNSRFLRKAEVQ